MDNSKNNIYKIKKNHLKIISEKELKIISEKIKEEYPERNKDFYKMFLSTELLRMLIDNEWVNQTLFSHHNTLEKKNLDGYNYFKSPILGYVWQTRICRLAERVYNLQNVPNFKNIIKDIINGEVVSRDAEIEVGGHLLSRNIKFEFVIPSNIKTNDFDIRITDPKINCEVKHKIESTKISANSLLNTIRSAKQQLPKHEPSIIFLKIPENWINDKIIDQIIPLVFDAFLKRNENILGIMIRWEEHHTIFKNILFTKFYFYKNDFSKLDAKLKLFISDLNGDIKNWVSFDEIIQKHT